MIGSRKFFVFVSLLLLFSFWLVAATYAQELGETITREIDAIEIEADPIEVESELIEIDPFWQHTTLVNVNLSIGNNGRATMAGSVVGNNGTSHIVVDAALDRVNPNGTTTRVASFNNMRAEGNMWAWSRPHYVARGHNYRLTITSTVFRNGSRETIPLSTRDVFAH